MGSPLLVMALIVGASHHAPSYVEQKSAQVLASFLAFKSAHRAEEAQNPLQQQRDRDALLLGGRAPSLQSGAMGAMLMGGAVFVAAHAPARLRPIVDGKVHFGPALFEGGGMGAGVGGRF